MAQPSKQVLSFSPDVLVTLMDIDLSPLGGPTMYLAPGREIYVPSSVLELMDGSQSLVSLFRSRVPHLGRAGQRLTFDGYGRSSVQGPNAPFVSLGIQSPGVASRIALNINADGSAHNFAMAGTQFTNPQVSVAQAGEFIYFRASVTLTVDMEYPEAFIFPTRGITRPTQDAYSTGSFLLARSDFSVGGGGGRRIIPIRQESWFTEQDPNYSIINVLENTHHAMKVPVHNGRAYTPIPVEATGFELSGQGSFPKPRLSISNVFGEAMSVIQGYGDLLGAMVTRRRIYSENLDNGPAPDPLALLPIDVFVISRKSMQDDTRVEWELSSDLDQQGATLPARGVLRDVCDWNYRVFNQNTGQFEWPNGEPCPYTGSNYFDADGNPVTNPAQDRCSRRRGTGCLKRYPRGTDSPFGAFSMVGRTQT